MRGTLSERFWAKVDQPAEGCWEWKASKYLNGYGQFNLSGKNTPAHRVAYELTFGQIDSPLHIDHLCRNKACVRPDHLEAVTCKVNVQRATPYRTPRAKPTHCPMGHEYSPANTAKEKSGAIYCRTCKRKRTNKWHRDNWPTLSERRAERKRA